MEERQKELGIEFAGFWIRLGAFVIDVIILGLLVCMIPYILGAFALSSPAIFVPNFFLALIWLAEIIYFVGFWEWRGQTPGKMVVGIRVIRTDGSSLTLSRALVRYVGYIVCSLTLFIGFIWLVFDSHKQGLHDKIADTYVIKLPVKEVILTKTYA